MVAAPTVDQLGGWAGRPHSRILRPGTHGGIISEAALRDAYGLSDSVIKDFFKNPITVSFGTAGDVSMTTSVSYFAGIRLYGDK
jgi:hypothetical protein